MHIKHKDHKLTQQLVRNTEKLAEATRGVVDAASTNRIESSKVHEATKKLSKLVDKESGFVEDARAKGGPELAGALATANKELNHTYKMLSQLEEKELSVRAKDFVPAGTGWPAVPADLMKQFNQDELAAATWLREKADVAQTPQAMIIDHRRVPVGGAPGSEAEVGARRVD
jgi:hypothetical protein